MLCACVTDVELVVEVELVELVVVVVVDVTVGQDMIPLESP